MNDQIRIQMMDHFTIYINEQKADYLVNKTRKGVALMEYLILHQGQPTPNYRLLVTLWSEDKSANPENALKTLVSRLRALLNQISPGLGKCIVADRGAYHWETLPGMTVDVFEIEQIFDELAEKKDDPEAKKALYTRLIRLYVGDLLQNGEQNEWALARGTTLHNKYMMAIYSYIDLLKQEEDYKEIVNVCRSALDVDNFDDRLHMELMTALIKTNRSNEALVQYKHVMHLNYRYRTTAIWACSPARTCRSSTSRSCARARRWISISRPSAASCARAASSAARSSANTPCSRRSSTSRCAISSGWARPCSWRSSWWAIPTTPR